MTLNTIILIVVLLITMLAVIVYFKIGFTSSGGSILDTIMETNQSLKGMSTDASSWFEGLKAK